GHALVFGDDRPPAVPSPLLRKTRIAEILGPDPRRACVDDGVLRVQVAVPLDDVRTTREPAHLDARSEEPTNHPMSRAPDPPDRRAIEEHANLHPALGRGREDRRDPFP